MVSGTLLPTYEFYRGLTGNFLQICPINRIIRYTKINAILLQMVTRSKDTIYYTPGEKIRFDIPDKDSIDRALDKADVFLEVGVGLARKAGIQLEVNDGFFMPLLRQRDPRGAELIDFSRAITGLCVEEFMERSLAQQPGEA